MGPSELVKRMVIQLNHLNKCSRGTAEAVNEEGGGRGVRYDADVHELSPAGDSFQLDKSLVVWT